MFIKSITERTQMIFLSLIVFKFHKKNFGVINWLSIKIRFGFFMKNIPIYEKNLLTVIRDYVEDLKYTGKNIFIWRHVCVKMKEICRQVWNRPQSIICDISLGNSEHKQTCIKNKVCSFAYAVLQLFLTEVIQILKNDLVWKADCPWERLKFLSAR